MPDTFRAWQREILDAAEERDWIVRRLDMREGIVLEDAAGALTIRIVGITLSPAFIRSMPLGWIRPARTLVDESPCWCRLDNAESHEPRCLERRALDSRIAS